MIFFLKISGPNTSKAFAPLWKCQPKWLFAHPWVKSGALPERAVQAFTQRCCDSEMLTVQGGLAFSEPSK